MGGGVIPPPVRKTNRLILIHSASDPSGDAFSSSSRERGGFLFSRGVLFSLTIPPLSSPSNPFTGREATALRGFRPFSVLFYCTKKKVRARASKEFFEGEFFFSWSLFFPLPPLSISGRPFAFFLPLPSISRIFAACASARPSSFFGGGRGQPFGRGGAQQRRR